jgi:hypothetical protein
VRKPAESVRGLFNLSARADFVAARLAVQLLEEGLGIEVSGRSNARQNRQASSADTIILVVLTPPFSC